MRVAKTLAEGSFPLTERVLAQMTGLSGAEFVLVTQEGTVEESTIRTDRDRREPLPQRLVLPVPESRSVKPSVVVGGREFFVDRVPVSARSPTGMPETLYILFPKDRWSARIKEATYPALTTGILAAVVCSWDNNAPAGSSDPFILSWNKPRRLPVGIFRRCSSHDGMTNFATWLRRSAK